MMHPSLLAILLLLASTASLSQPSDTPSNHQQNIENHPQEVSQIAEEQTEARRLFKRSYYPSPMANAVRPAPFQSLTVWKPPTYQLSRPYYVPVFGAAGRIHLYSTTKPLYLNPGVPPANPRPPFAGPTYLPPSVTQSPPEDTTMRLDNRFNNDDNEGRPIWDVVTPETPRDGGVRPTRPPAAPSQSTAPPLIHNGGGAAVAPPLPANLPQRPPQRTTPRPAGPSKCVWAIISCCSTTSEIRYNCFEELGCTGAFWDKSPCEGEFAEAAIKEALDYYTP